MFESEQVSPLHLSAPSPGMQGEEQDGGEEPAFSVAVTTAVAADEAVAEPAELLAVTETLIVDPTSADPRR